MAGPAVSALDLVRDGKPVSTIVVPEHSAALEREGAETLAKYLHMASGAQIPIVKEGERAEGAVVSFGETRMAKAAHVNDRHLKWDGYRMVVKGGVLYLFGRDEAPLNGTGAQGSRRVAFGLLDRLGFRWLQPTPMGTYIPNLKVVSVPDDLNVTYEPPLMFMHGRMTNWGDWSMANSFRDAVKIYTAGGHTWAHGVPASLFATHPEYFVMRGGKRMKPAQEDNPQYCPSNPEVRRLVADWTIKKFDEGYDIVALGQSDGFIPCQCPLCSKLTPEQQAQDAEDAIIKLVRKKYPDRKVHLLIYEPTSSPPVSFKNYPPNTMGEVCLNETLRKQFGTYNQALEYWRQSLPAGISVYVYYMGLYTSAGIAPRFYPKLAAEKIKDWIAHGVQGIYWCGGGENWGAEGPTYYVIGRVATDPSLDWEKTYEEYLNLTFGKAAPSMKEYYDTLYGRLERYRDHNVDCDLVGIGSPEDTFTGAYSSEVLLRLKGFLEQSKKVAAGDARALGWIRLAEISYNQFALIAEAFHFYQAYLLNPSAENFTQVHNAVEAYQSWAAGAARLAAEDKAFVENFFPNYGGWASPEIKTNCGHLACPPFNLNYDKMHQVKSQRVSAKEVTDERVWP
jgi:hypothetical protein